MFRSYSAANSRHVEKFCGVMLSVHVLTPETADSSKTLLTQPLSFVKMAEHFECLASFQVLDSIPVEKYQSKRTGINFCFAKVPGPLVNGFLCLGKFELLSSDLKLSAERRGGAGVQKVFL